MADNAKRRYHQLVDDIADMIAKQTYNRAPINYGIAERAIAMVVRRRVRPLERALRAIQMRAEDEVWAGHPLADEILAVVGGLQL